MSHELHIERTTKLVEELTPEAGRDLLHLTGCRECIALAERLLAADLPRSSREVDYGPLLTELEVRSPGLLNQMAARKAEVERRFADLMEHSPAARLEAVATEERYQDPGLVDLCLYESWAAQPGDPVQAEHLAVLGLTAAEEMTSRGVEVEDLLARAHALWANARRLQGDEEDAEKGFREAARHLTGSSVAGDRALFCQFLALLRRDQGRLDEAAGLLWRAGTLHGEVGEVQEEGSCFTRLGLLLVEEGSLEEAESPLRRACDVLDARADPGRAARARLALAYCYARLGRKAGAVRLARSARPLYEHTADARAIRIFAWFEGRIAVLTGRLEEAVSFLGSARGGFLAAGELREAARATVDLALALAEAGSPRSIPKLLRRFPAEPRDGVEKEIVRTLGDFLVIAASPRALDEIRDASLQAEERLRRLFPAGGTDSDD